MFETLSAEGITAIITSITTVAGVIVAVIQSVKKGDWISAFKSLNDLMNPNKPQTDDQTALITEGKVEPATWKITETEINRIMGILRNMGVNISENSIRRVIEQAEANNEVEYAIRICENKSPEVYPTLFISYGVGEFYKTFADAQVVIINHSARVYSVAG